MTLTDFLLARIAEDEGAARSIHARNCDTPAETILDTMERPMSPVCGCDWYIARVLAECEAKRRIVEDENSNDWQPLRYLATVYADHPDYRQEWKP